MPRIPTSPGNRHIKIEKSRTVKRNYQRRQHGFRFTEQELAQITRNEELQRRADKIKEKEKKAKLNKKKKEEKEAKAREERKRLGLPEPGIKIGASQQRLSQLFGSRKKKSEVDDNCGLASITEQETNGYESGECQELDPVNNRVPAVDPEGPVQIFEDVDEDGDSEMPELDEETVKRLLESAVAKTPQESHNLTDGLIRHQHVLTCPHHNAPFPDIDADTSNGIDAGSMNTSTNSDHGLPKTWEVCVDSASQIEKDLAEDEKVQKDTTSIIMSNTIGQGLENLAKFPTSCEILAPKPPSRKLNASKEQSPEDVIALISTQDLASDKENLDPAQPSPGENAPNYNYRSSRSPSRTKRTHEDAFGDDEDKENVPHGTKYLKRDPLPELPDPSKKPNSPIRTLRSPPRTPKKPLRQLLPSSADRKTSPTETTGSVHRSDCLERENGIPSKLPSLQAMIQNSSQDEYGFLDTVEAARLAARYDTPSAVPGTRRAVQQNSSHDEYGWKDLDGVEAEQLAAHYDAPSAPAQSEFEIHQDTTQDELGLGCELLARVRSAEAKETQQTPVEGRSSQEWPQDFLMGTQELKDIGLAN
jgi:hypothetical protein